MSNNAWALMPNVGLLSRGLGGTSHRSAKGSYRTRSGEMKDLRIRWLIPEDRDRIGKIIARAGVFNPVELKVALELVDEALLRPERDEYYALCAVNGRNEVIGYACFGPVPMTDRCFDLYWIAVDESAAGQGVGKRLMDGVEDFARKRNARRIYVETSSTSPYDAARSFYSRNGYRLECVLEGFYRQDDHKIIYRKEL